MPKLTVSLTGRRPVSIDKAEWPIIAHVADWRGGQVECQANEEFELTVRQHADGRAIVSAYRDRGPGGMPIQYEGGRAGYLLAADADVADAIIRAADAAGVPSSVAERCVAGLPAEEL